MDSPETPNQQLHEYVTSGIFTMTLHKSHIAVLEQLYRYQNRPFIEYSQAVNGTSLLRRMSVTANHSLEHRGLVIALPRRDKGLLINYVLRDRFRLTKAGELMVELLKESGLITPDLKPLPKLKQRVCPK